MSIIMLITLVIVFAVIFAMRRNRPRGTRLDRVVHSEEDDGDA